MRRRFEKAFTLAEVILATVILCCAVLALGAIGARPLAETRLNRQYELAATLVDRQLNMIDFVGIEEFIQSGQTEGYFEEFEPLYHWAVSAESEGIDYLYTVTITVSWVERNRPYSLSVETRFDGKGILTGLE